MHQRTFATAGELHESVDGDGQVYPPSATQLPRGRRQVQRRTADEAVEEKFEYGSREADQAAQKLQSLGAMVYPPGKEGTFDWGILAGPAQPLSVCLSVYFSVCLSMFGCQSSKISSGKQHPKCLLSTLTLPAAGANSV